MGGRSHSSGNVRQEIRFASYIEEKHSSAIDAATSTREAIINDSPYGYTSPDINSAFFSLGYALSSFPALYDQFGKNMAGLDIDSLFSNNFSEKINTVFTDDYIESELTLINDAINQNQKEQLKAREFNSINTSSFIIAKANIEKNKIIKTTELRLDVKDSLIPGIVETWNTTLSWDKSIITNYAKSLKDYYLCKINVDEADYKKQTENTIWPLTVLDFERTVLAAMRGTKAPRVMTKKERSDLSKALLVSSDTLQGSQLGSYWGPAGTVIGGVVGFTVGIATILTE